MEKPKALIVGADGFLGGYLAAAAEREFEIIRGGRSPNGTGTMALDIADAASVRRVFEHVRPQAVVLLAAISDIDLCQSHPKQAFAVNVRGAEVVANLCARMNARLLFTSTAAVFDGRKHGYREEDEVCPLSVYGISKAQAEKAVRALVPGAIIARFSLVLGFAKRAGTNSMVDTLYAKWKANVPVPVPTGEFRNPLHAASLSEILLRLMLDRGAHGTFHIGACDAISRFDLARHLAVRAGFPEHFVEPQASPVPDRAPRGRDHFLLTDKLQSWLRIKSPSCEQEIARCFDGPA